MTAPTIPGRFMGRLTGLGLPTDQLKKVLGVFLDYVKFRDGEPPKARHEASQPDLLGSGPAPWPEDAAEQFWQAYPRRVGKGAAIRKLQSIEKSATVPFETILAAVVRFKNASRLTAMGYIPHPATWLNAERWNDEAAALITGDGNGQRNPTMEAFDDLIARAAGDEVEGNPPMRDVTPRGAQGR